MTHLIPTEIGIKKVANGSKKELGSGIIEN